MNTTYCIDKKSKMKRINIMPASLTSRGMVGKKRKKEKGIHSELTM